MPTNEHRGDIIDQANDLAARLTSAAESVTRAAAAPEQVRNADGTWPIILCVDCEEPIEPGRLEMGRIRCLSCQQDKEQRSKQYAR